MYLASDSVSDILTVSQSRLNLILNVMARLMLVSWSLTSLVSTNIAISETKLVSCLAAYVLQCLMSQALE